MLLRQIQYFQTVVQKNSFTEAAAWYDISQSAVSQQIQALERELGVDLLERRNRKFVLTPSGEHFYARSLVLTADLERICRETIRLAHQDEERLDIGYLRCYGGGELPAAVAGFSRQHPDVRIDVIHGDHEDLYDALRFGKVDLVLNDQRRAFSDEYVNLPLAEVACSIELPPRSPLSGQDGVEVSDLRDTPCVLVASPGQRENERTYYRDIIGLKGEILFAESLQDARILVAAGRGVLPVEGTWDQGGPGPAPERIPLLRDGDPVRRTYCAFWKKDHPGRWTEPFASLLKAQFDAGARDRTDGPSAP